MKEKGMIGKAYNWLDNQIMKGVNAGVRAYNWTTGRTKLDLAKNLLCGAPVVENIGIATLSPYNLFLSVPVSILTSCLQYGIHTHLYNREINALEKNARDALVELEKKTMCRLGGWAFPLFGLLYFAPVRDTSGRYSTNDLFGTYCAIGMGLRGLSYWVMCADNLPPRKNCFSRGFNKLKEYAAAIKDAVQPASQPAPVAVQTTMNEPTAYTPLEARI